MHVAGALNSDFCAQLSKMEDSLNIWEESTEMRTDGNAQLDGVDARLGVFEFVATFQYHSPIHKNKTKWRYWILIHMTYLNDHNINTL